MKFTSKDTATMDIGGSAPPLAAEAPATPLPPTRNNGQTPTQQGLTAGPGQLSSTPPRVVLATDRGSAVSCITNATNAASATTPDCSTTRPAIETIAEELPSPTKQYPDFSKPHSDGNSVASGDDSEGWKREEEGMMATISAQNAAEEREADALEDIVDEIEEWELAAEEPGGIIEGSADGPVEYEYETHDVTMKWTSNELKDVARALKLPVSGNKRSILERIRDCGNELITKTDDTAFVYKRKKLAEDKHRPRWVLLNPEEAPPVEGIDMATGAERGFFGPTNKENAAGATKHNYLMHRDEKIVRPTFSYPPKKTSSSTAPNTTNTSNTTQSDTTPTPSERGGPSEAAKKLIPNLRYARPKDFFDTQITPEFIKKVIVPCTNGRAAADGAGFGGSMYQDYVPFDHVEINKMIGLLFANGVSPKPAMELWFKTTTEHRLFGNDFIAAAMDKQMKDGKKVPGIRRWKHFRRFMCLYDFRLNANTEKEKNPLWKVQSLLDELNHQAKKMWLPGKWVSIDEQTLGFKGKSGMKLRISYKREGDGFQCDAVCDRGYTFAFYFRHGDAPTLPIQYKHLELSPTARRVVWLALQLPYNWHCIFMDNLFNSRKLFSALWIAQALAHGVVRTSGRGIPTSIRQFEEKNANKAEALRGTTKAAKLLNCRQCPDLVAVSVYDTKPVHLLSSVSESVCWLEKKRKVWSTAHKDMKLIGFLRLNMIDDYNNKMNSTDIADQLRNVYRMDYWTRNRKWWWAFFIWAIGVAATNGWKMYTEMHAEEEKKGTEGLPPKLSHLEFLVELVNDFIYPEQTKFHVEQLREMDDSSFASTVRTTRSLSSFRNVTNTQCNGWDFTCESGIADYVDSVKPSALTKSRMERSNFFARRLDGTFHAFVPAANDSRCQYCYYQWSNDLDESQKEVQVFMKQNRKQTSRCLICNVNLCPNCFNEFHGFNMTNNVKLMGY